MLLFLPSLTATEALAVRIAGLARPGDAILLNGPLGAGKTALARALLRAAAGDPALEVPSPSYTLVQSYDTPCFRAYHFDLWRLDGRAAVVELGWDEARADVVIVEWPDRLGELRPDPALEAGVLDIAIAPGPGETRSATLAGWPDRLGRLLGGTEDAAR